MHFCEIDDVAPMADPLIRHMRTPSFGADVFNELFHAFEMSCECAPTFRRQPIPGHGAPILKFLACHYVTCILKSPQVRARLPSVSPSNSFRRLNES